MLVSIVRDDPSQIRVSSIRIRIEQRRKEKNIIEIR